jgi:hypothetical protein
MKQMALLGDVLPKAKGAISDRVARAVRLYQRMQNSTTPLRYRRCNAGLNLLLTDMSPRELSEYYAAIRGRSGIA